MIGITVREGDSLEAVLRKFKRLCDREGLRKALRQHEHYEKPSDARRRKLKDRQRALRKVARLETGVRQKAISRARRISLGEKPKGNDEA